MTTAVVPVKDLHEAKSRLAGHFSQAQRRALVLAMLEDVLAVLSRVPALTGIAVVTREPAVIELATRFAAETIFEPHNEGYSAAVLRAARVLDGRSARAMLVVPGDVPGATSEEISLMLRTLAPAPSVLLVPSADEQGTNAVLLAPPLAMALQFGEPSFSPHVTRARSAGLAVDILHLPGLSLDIDTPEDIASFLACPRETCTRMFLRQTLAESA